MKINATTGPNRAGHIAVAFRALGIAVPALASLWCIQRFTVNVPFMDDWEVQPVLEVMRTGHLPLDIAWNNYYDHRVFFPQLLLGAVALVSNWDITPQVYLNFGLNVVTWALLCWLIGAADLIGWRRWLVLTLTSVMVFAPAAWETWTWAWTIQRYLSVTATVASTALLVRIRNQQWSLVLAVACCIVASGSSVDGLTAWPAGGAAIWFLWSGRPRVKALLGWSAAAILTATVYAYGYHPATGLSSLQTSLEPGKPLAVNLSFLFTYLGSWMGEGLANMAALAGEQPLSRPLAIGAADLLGRSAFLALVACCLAAWRSVRLRALLLPSVILGLQSFATGGLAMFGRGWFIANGLQSRYTPLSILLWIALLVPAITLLDWPKTPLVKRVTSGGLAALAVLILATDLAMYREAIGQLEDHQRQLVIYGEVLRSTTTDPALLSAPTTRFPTLQPGYLYPSIPELMRRNAELRAWRSSYFARGGS